MKQTPFGPTPEDSYTSLGGGLLERGGRPVTTRVKVLPLLPPRLPHPRLERTRGDQPSGGEAVSLSSPRYQLDVILHGPPEIHQSSLKDKAPVPDHQRGLW